MHTFVEQPQSISVTAALRVAHKTLSFITALRLSARQPIREGVHIKLSRVGQQLQLVLVQNAAETKAPSFILLAAPTPK